MSITHEQRQSSTLRERFPDIRAGNLIAPHCLEIHPTDFCNQACSYCFHGGNGFTDAEPVKKVTGEEYAAIFDEAEQLGIKEISISGGGEPFFSPDISEILNTLSQRDLTVRVVSHGNYIPDTAMPGILAANDIRFSIDSTYQQTYNNMRGLTPSSKMLDRTIANIQKIVAARRLDEKSSLNIGATCIIGPENYEQLDDFAATLIDDVGIDTVIFKYDIYGLVGADPSKAEYVLATLEDIKHRYKDRVTVREDIEIDPNGKPCVAPYTKVALDTKGELHSCCLGAQPGEKNGYTLGNVREHGLTKVWEQSRATRQTMLGGVACTNCNHTDRLLNQSYATWLGSSIPVRRSE